MAGGTRSFEMAKRMVAAGHEVDMITTSREDGVGNDWIMTEESGIRVHWLPVPYSNQMDFLQRVWAFIRFAYRCTVKASSLKGDVVFATSTPLTIAIPGVLTSRRLGKPMVFEVRDLWPQLPIAIGVLKSPILIKLANWLERWAYSNSKRVVALSSGMKEGVVRVGYPENHVTVIPNSCDINLFGISGSDDDAAVSKLLPWLGERKLVVYTGTFGAINGTDYLIHVAYHLAKSDEDVQFLLVGDGIDYDKNVDLANSLGVLGRNLHIMKSIPKTELVAIIRRATVATSLFINLEEMWANSANKFFDALAASRPIMINYKGWQADLLLESGAGIVVPPDDTIEASRLLLALLNDDERLKKASQASCDLAHKMFNRDLLADRLIKVLENAVEAS